MSSRPSFTKEEQDIIAAIHTAISRHVHYSGDMLLKKVIIPEMQEIFDRGYFCNDHYHVEFKNFRDELWWAFDKENNRWILTAEPFCMFSLTSFHNADYPIEKAIKNYYENWFEGAYLNVAELQATKNNTLSPNDFVGIIERETGLDAGKHFGIVPGTESPYIKWAGMVSACKVDGYKVWKRTEKENLAIIMKSSGRLDINLYRIINFLKYGTVENSSEDKPGIEGEKFKITLSDNWFG